MNYEETLDYLFSQLPVFQRVGKSAYKANLDNTIALDNYFGNPHKNFKTVHIAGTNGKGSTSHMLASVLIHAGYKVGLYTSPHLKDFRERIKINGEMIPEHEVIDFVEKHRLIFETVKPSFFEMTVALAFDFFNRLKVDIAVIEVGLGGRLDSTNIITPELSLITNIGMDHTDLLGDTMEKIAYEKAGIIKQGVPIVISETQPEISEIFIHKANVEQSNLYFADQRFRVIKSDSHNHDYQIFEIEGTNKHQTDNYKVDLSGQYQSMNILGILLAVDILREKGIAISDFNLKNGLANAASSTGLKGRWQKLNETPLVICDTGHNVDGIKQVVDQIAKVNYSKLHMVIGMVGDKNIDRILQLLPKEANYYFTKASIPRALDEIKLADKALEYNLKGKTYSTVKDAYETALASASEDDLIFVGGSTFVVAEVL